MHDNVIVFDLETIPDLEALTRVHDLAPDDLDGARAALGDKFPKLPLHAVACIGALIAERVGDAYEIRSRHADSVQLAAAE